MSNKDCGDIIPCIVDAAAGFDAAIERGNRQTPNWPVKPQSPLLMVHMIRSSQNNWPPVAMAPSAVLQKLRRRLLVTSQEADTTATELNNVSLDPNAELHYGANKQMSRRSVGEAENGTKHRDGDPANATISAATKLAAGAIRIGIDLCRELMRRRGKAQPNGESESRKRHCHDSKGLSRHRLRISIAVTHSYVIYLAK